MLRVVLDTHAVIWYLFADSRLSITAYSLIEQIAIEANQVAFSSITLAEIVYLSEKERINRTTLTRLLREVDSEQALFMEIPFDKYVAQAMQQVERSQVPDLPDRIIAATALSLKLPLISRDRKIQMSNVETIW
jgi:PIN domain nuclease of toxin-antitoxin system